MIIRNLGRLHHHQQNIVKFQKLSEFDNLNKEHINATRTVQQLKSNMLALERTRHQVEESEQEKFDAKVKDIQREAAENVADFLNTHGKLEQPFGQSTATDIQSDSSSDNLIHRHSVNVTNTDGDHVDHPLDSGMQYFDGLEQKSEAIQTQDLMEEVRQTKEAEASLEHLRENLEDFNSIIHDFSSIVHAQQETIDSIEDNVENAHEDVHKGTIQLSNAAKLKAVMIPIAGAVVGTVVAGPVGLIAGAKIGGLIGAVGGGVIGFTSGKYIKKKKDEGINIEMKKMEDKLETSSTSQS
ncbi:unnamed protein product [Owenia fusiformis]|uniref:t-SNARE coiled-coil homology domain-containing protein n=1 Tax=Owenia fusiformis TaxID=6347 RepID=A0A8S4P580_OWEFU|nr:unnamed protein product [Owenia fusiformis]